MLKEELGEYVRDLSKKVQDIDQDTMVEQIKEEVVDRFNSNLVSL